MALVCPFCGGILKETDYFLFGFFQCSNCLKEVSLKDIEMTNPDFITMTSKELKELM